MSPHLDIGSYIGLALIAVLSTYGVLLYNNLVALKHAVARAWSNIDVLLKQRHDELPKLVEACKQYMRYEQETLERVMQARSAVSAARTKTDVAALGAAETQLRTGLFQLFAVAEAYPELKADANFRDLQDKLSGIEDEIQLSRRYYNGAVRNLNTMIESFPTNLIAGPFGFTKAEFFEIGDAAAREVPKVDFKTR
jgi:LemA protein